MSQKFRRILEMVWALLWNRQIRLGQGARIFGRVRMCPESSLLLAPCGRVDGLEIHGRGTLHIGPRAELKNLYVDFGLSNGTITISEDVYIANGAKLVIFGRLCIGAGSILGPDVLIVDTQHRYGHGVNLRRSGVDVHNISIGANCWVGGRAAIMPGVQIGDDVVIGAGSVVTRDCLVASVYAGVPAKRIKGYE